MIQCLRIIITSSVSPSSFFFPLFFFSSHNPHHIIQVFIFWGKTDECHFTENLLQSLMRLDLSPRKWLLFLLTCPNTEKVIFSNIAIIFVELCNQCLQTIERMRNRGRIKLILVNKDPEPGEFLFLLL